MFITRSTYCASCPVACMFWSCTCAARASKQYGSQPDSTVFSALQCTKKLASIGFKVLSLEFTQQVRAELKELLSQDANARQSALTATTASKGTSSHFALAISFVYTLLRPESPMVPPGCAATSATRSPLHFAALGQEKLPDYNSDRSSCSDCAGSKARTRCQQM